MKKKNVLITIIVCSMGLSSCWLVRGIKVINFTENDYLKIPYITFQSNHRDSFLLLLAKDKTAQEEIISITNQIESGSNFNKTKAFIVFKNNQLVYKRYFHGFKENDMYSTMSLTKSITALLLFMAIDEGKIASIKDPITDYLPQLLENDTNFKKVTIYDVLNMRSGIDFDDPSLKENCKICGKNCNMKAPFTKFARFALGRNQNSFVNKLKTKFPADSIFCYQNINTQILAMIIEKVTNMELQSYFEKKLWKPLEMQEPATWNIDDKCHKKVKGYANFNTNVTNLSKIGLMLANYGFWNERQILKPCWIDSLMKVNLNKNYKLHFWKKLHNSSFTMEGSYGQIMYINPKTKTVMLTFNWNNKIGSSVYIYYNEKMGNIDSLLSYK